MTKSNCAELQAHPPVGIISWLHDWHLKWIWLKKKRKKKDLKQHFSSKVLFCFPFVKMYDFNLTPSVLWNSFWKQTGKTQSGHFHSLVKSNLFLCFSSLSPSFLPSQSPRRSSVCLARYFIPSTFLSFPVHSHTNEPG